MASRVTYSAARQDLGDQGACQITLEGRAVCNAAGLGHACAGAVDDGIGGRQFGIDHGQLVALYLTVIEGLIDIDSLVHLRARNA